ncbi:uncharacterized protein LOC134267893 [Saccostrea cucullata]|uniref:uncharacterized protein LOC134267893 n=1 Tax=Saccostrea cuccullata TaxID=36930 RepID=UPI002ED1A5D6
MPKTKVTPRKPGFLCCICLSRLPTKDEWGKHILNCGVEDINKRKFECDHCDKAFSKKIVLVRHVKRVHPNQETTYQNKTPKQVEDEEDWRKDPGQLLFEDVDLEAGRTYRKKTSPVLPGIKRRNASVQETVTKDLPTTTEEVVEPSDSGSDAQNEPFDEQHCVCCQKKVQKVDVETQTDAIKAEKSHQKIIRVTRKFQKDGEIVERLEEDIWND